MTAAWILAHSYPQEGCAGYVLDFSREAAAQVDGSLKLNTLTRGSLGCECSYSRTAASEPA